MTTRTPILWLVSLPLATLLIGYVFVSTVGVTTIEAAYDGESLTRLNQLFAAHRNYAPDFRDLDYFKERVSGFLYRCVIVLAICETWCVLVYVRRNQVFQRKAHPVSLAIFRIITFAMIASLIDVSALRQWANFPSGLLRPPVGTGWLANAIPINESWLLPAGWLCMVAAWCSVIGLFTRASTWITALLGMVCFGVPQMFGKVSHYHDLVWFALILAASPCGDALSIDASLRAWKKARTGQLPVSAQPESKYGLPLVFASLMLGIIYFFPGMWKFLHNGSEWVLGDNLRLIMYQKWVSIEGWTPAIRIDHFGRACQMFAFLTIIFEMGFIFMVLFRRTLPVAAIGGVCLHVSIRMFMFIPTALYNYYVCLFDWDGIFTRLGRAIGLRPVTCSFASSVPRLRSFAAVAKSLDICNCLTLVEQSEEIDSVRVCDTISGDMLASGALSLRYIASCIPIMWPLSLLMRVNGMRERVGRFLLAEGKGGMSAPPEVTKRNSSNSVLLTGVAVSLLVVNSIFGFLRIEKAWPFSCYPTFSSLAGRTRQAISVEVGIPGQSTTMSRTEIRERLRMTHVRFDSMIQGILKQSETERNQQFDEIWAKIAKADPGLSNERVRFFNDTLSVIPDEWAANPIDHKLLYSLEPSSADVE